MKMEQPRAAVYTGSMSYIPVSLSSSAFLHRIGVHTDRVLRATEMVAMDSSGASHYEKC